jgi:hypothetical protein
VKKQVLFLLLCFASIMALQAQTGTPGNKQVEYKTYMRLQPGEKAIPFYSCMWLNEKDEFNRLVIQHADNKYSVITAQGRKDNLSLEAVLAYANNPDCNNLDPHRPAKATRYTGSKLVKINANGSKIISANNKNYGPFEEIIFIQENGERFVTVVKAHINNKTEILYIDSEGKKNVLDARPLQVITNASLTKAAVLLPPADATPVEIVNTWPKEKQYAYFDSLSKKQERIWFNNDSSGSIAKKHRRLEYDVSGNHFVAVYTDHFLIDGKKVNKNISGAGTRLYAGKDPGSWAYSFEIYLAFSDGASFQNVINPFLTTENGKGYLNWFVIESNKNGDIIKSAKKEL